MDKNSSFCHTTQDAHRSTLFIKNNQLKFVNLSVAKGLDSIETLKVVLLKDAPAKLGSPHW